MFKQSNRAFTLIELLVVVLIIGILAAVALPQYQKAVEKSRAVEAVQNFRAIEKCMDLHVLENGFSSAQIEDLNCPIEPMLGQFDEVEEYWTTEHFRYFGSVHSDQYLIEIHRIPEEYYVLYKDKTGAQCITQETNMGQYICESLKSQGFHYVETQF